MATATTPRITAEQFLRMDLGDGLHELVRGEVIEVTPPEYWHGYICSNFVFRLKDFGLQAGHGHVGSNDSAVTVGEDTVRGADVAYYTEARWPRARVGKEPPPGPPDLVVEVVSATDRPGKVMQKVGDYLTAGVPMVWLAHPRPRTLTIYRNNIEAQTVVLREGDVVEHLPELPGFRCPVADFFA